MYKSFENKLRYSAILLCCLISGAPQLKSNPRFNPNDFKTSAEFALANHQSGLIQQGSTKVSTVSAFVAHVNGLIPGNAEGFEIQFFTKPMTGADETDVLEKDAKGMRKSSYAALVLFLYQEKIAQVNMSYMVPGTTVARTVAWKPADLKKYFSDYSFDGKRLQLKSKGTYDELNSKQEAMSLSWDVNIDLPVIDRRKK